MAKKAKKNKKAGNPKSIKKAKKVVKKAALVKKKPTKKAIVKKKPVTPKKPAKKVIIKKVVTKKPSVASKKAISKKELAISPKKAINVVTKVTNPVSSAPVKSNKEMLLKKPSSTQQASVPVEIIEKPLKITVKSGPKKPEPKGKYILEFSVRSSIPVLFEFISTPSGLSEWFSDNVSVQTGGFFTFYWDGVPQQAKLIGYRDQEMAKFEWVGKNDGSYFEFRIQTDELTGDVSLIITDFADPSEVETNKLVWNSQVDDLLHTIGSYSG